MSALEKFVATSIRSALQNVGDTELKDVYALSFFVYDYDDDPRTPTLTLGYNTRARWRACTPAPGQAPAWPIASDSDEAKWNYAFWLQNKLLVLGEPGSEGAALCEQWLKSSDLWFTDDEEAQDSEKCDQIAERITQGFVTLSAHVAHALHDEGFLYARFGRHVPIIIHELEYYEEIAEQTERANPPGIAAEFVAWVNRPL